MAMIETLHPGVYVVEKRGQPLVQPVGVATGSLVGRFKKGPLNKPGFVTSWKDFIRLYGGYYKQWTAPNAAYLFFENGGQRLFLARVAKDDADTASGTLKCLDNTGSAASISALNEGDWGNNVTLNTTKYAFKTAAAITSAVGLSELLLTSVQGVEKGDRIIFTDGTSQEIVTVLTIDSTTNKVTFKGFTPAATIASGSDALCSSVHRVKTTLAAALATGATTALLTDAGQTREGTVLTFASTLAEIDVVVTGVSGNTVNFAAITLGATIAAGSIAVSQEFNLIVYEDGIQSETPHYFLSMEATNEQDYIETRLKDDGNQSVVIEVSIGTPSGTLRGQYIPYPVLNAALTGGLDGGTPQDADYIGTATAGQETGLHLLDRVDEINMVSIPGVTSVAVEGYMITWCENRHANADPVFAILDTPYADDTPQEAQEFKMLELNRDSSHAAIYFPWVKMPYPPVSGLILDQPPCGAIMGIYARVARFRGVHKAPANEEIKGIVGLTYNTTNGEQDILNPVGVNVIRSFPNRGIRVWGARTLTSLLDGRHYIHKRRTLNFIEESVAEAIQWSVFEPHDSDLWDQVRLQIQVFLNTMWRGGALQPKENRNEAYFVKVDADNNPQSEIDAGRLNIEVGVNVVGVAEFVIFEVGLWDGGRLLQEVTG